MHLYKLTRVGYAYVNDVLTVVIAAEHETQARELAAILTNPDVTDALLTAVEARQWLAAAKVTLVGEAAPGTPPGPVVVQRKQRTAA